MKASAISDPGVQISNLKQYYRLHALIYDVSRWAFLFGRERLLRELPLAAASSPRILEVGCGTGKNLAVLARRFPKARLTGIDLSADMLGKAQKKLAGFADRVRLLEEPYQAGSAAGSGFDLILFSYSLSMMGPQWNAVLDQAREDLKPGGIAAAVDFSNSRFDLFRAHMANNHVRMEGHLLPGLRERFEPVLDQEPDAYLGLWQYLLFVGRKV